MFFRWNADSARHDLSEGRRVPPGADRAEPRDGTPSRTYPDLARIEHAKAKEVAILDRTGGDDLGEEADANAHQICGSRRARRLRDCAAARRANRGKRLVECGRIVAAVVFPAANTAPGMSRNDGQERR